MPIAPSSLRLTGATVLRDGAMQSRSVAIAEGRISKGPLPEVNLKGYYILPGIIDLHGDALTRHLGPQPNTRIPLRTTLRATDRDAAANGVTTAWMAQGWSWEGGTRGPDHAEALLEAVDACADETLTDLRVQIRCETHTVDTADRLLAAVRRHRIDYVVFTNHLDAALVQADTDPSRLAEQARQAGRTVDEHVSVVRAALGQGKDVPRYLCRLADAFDTLGVTYGSHNDRDGETREYFSQIGAKICELPAHRSAAALARAVGDPILMSAPNILRGGVQPGCTITTRDLIGERMCDALVAGGYYPALVQAAFCLVDDGVADLPGAWAMLSSNPANILRMPDRGRIDYGCRADLVVINAQTRAVEATMCGGRITYLAGEAAHRFRQIERDTRLAAE